MGLVANDIISVTYKGTCDNQQIRTVLHFKCLTPGSSSTPESDLMAVADDFTQPLTNQVTSKMQDCCAGSMHWYAVAAQRVYPNRTIAMTDTAAWNGVAPGDSAPANVSAVITKRTTVAGRMGTGSVHLCAVPISWIVESLITNMAPFNAFAAALLPMHTVSSVQLNLDPGLFNPTHPPSFFGKLFDAVANPEVRTMRRRTVGRGI